jgi:hypothetical protein
VNDSQFTHEWRVETSSERILRSGIHLRAARVHCCVVLSPTSDTANPNPNGLGSGSPPRISPLSNRVIRRVIRLPTSTRTQPATRMSSLMRLLQTQQCGESGSASRNREMGRGWGGEDGWPLVGAAWVAVVGGSRWVS